MSVGFFAHRKRIYENGIESFGNPVICDGPHFFFVRIREFWSTVLLQDR
jgi:hypothetical protein